MIMSTKYSIGQQPRPLKSSQFFLGFTGYYRSFIPYYSKLTCEMDSQKRKKTLKWSTKKDKNFKTLKKCFNQWPLQAYPEFLENAEKFEVKTDISAKSLGAVLEQVQDRQKRFIAAIVWKTTTGKKIMLPTMGILSPSSMT